MPGFVPNEGETLILQCVFKFNDAASVVDRGASLSLELFTNASVSETTTEAALTHPTGGSYAAKTLADASWTITNDDATYAQQTFTAGSGGYTGNVQGYAIISTGTTPRLLAIEVDPNGPYTMAVNDTYDIDLSNVAA